MISLLNVAQNIFGLQCSHSIVHNVEYYFFYIHLYYIIFLTFGEKKHFFLFLHFISLCLNFSSKILLYISSFFLSFKKNWYQLYITHNMLLFFILLYYYQQEDWTFCFCFFIAKKLEQTDHRYLLILTIFYFILLGIWQR